MTDDIGMNKGRTGLLQEKGDIAAIDLMRLTMI